MGDNEAHYRYIRNGLTWHLKVFATSQPNYDVKSYHLYNPKISAT